MTEPTEQQIMVELLSMISVTVDKIFLALVVGILILSVRTFVGGKS